MALCTHGPETPGLPAVIDPPSLEGTPVTLSFFRSKSRRHEKNDAFHLSVVEDLNQFFDQHVSNSFQHVYVDLFLNFMPETKNQILDLDQLQASGSVN